MAYKETKEEMDEKVQMKKIKEEQYERMKCCLKKNNHIKNFNHAEQIWNETPYVLIGKEIVSVCSCIQEVSTVYRKCGYSEIFKDMTIIWLTGLPGSEKWLGQMFSKK